MKKILILFALFIAFNANAQLPPAEFPDGVKTKLLQATVLTTTQRDALSYSGSDRVLIYNITTDQYEYWDGTAWAQFNTGGGSADGYISSVALNGTDLDFTGVLSGFTGTVDLSSISGTGLTLADVMTNGNQASDDLDMQGLVINNADEVNVDNKVSIGSNTSALFGQLLDVDNVYTSGSDYYGIYNNHSKENTGGTGDYSGIVNQTIENSTGGSDDVRGYKGITTNTGSGQVSTLYGNYWESRYANIGSGNTITDLGGLNNKVFVESSGTHTVSNLVGSNDKITLDSAGANVTNGSGSVSDLEINAGTVTNYTGVKIDIEQSGGTISDGSYLEVSDGIDETQARVNGFKVIESLVDLPSTFAGSIEAKSLSITGGTSTEALMANGSTEELVFQSLDEGNGTGYRFQNADLAKLANIGNGSLDLTDTTGYTGIDFGVASDNSFSWGVGSKLSTAGSSGNFGNHFSVGADNIVHGYYNNMAFGTANSITNGYSAIAMGYGNIIDLSPTVGQGVAIGNFNTLDNYWVNAIGFGTISKWFGGTVVGQANENLGDTFQANDRPIFVVGNGEISALSGSYGNVISRSDALRVRQNGELELPDYGQNTFAGTATYLLGVDANGKVVETSSSGGGVTIGSSGQIPFVNAGGTDFDYDSDFSFDGNSFLFQHGSNSSNYALYGFNGNPFFTANSLDMENDSGSIKIGDVDEVGQGNFIEINFNDGDTNFQGEVDFISQVDFGNNDLTVGSFYVYGNNASLGGLGRFYNSASEDTNVEWYELQADDDFKIKAQTTDALLIDSATLKLQASGTDIADITEAKDVITKEYADANYFEASERVELQVRFDEAVAKGDPVYITGFNLGQNRITVAKADASNSAKMPSIGLAGDSYALNDNGIAITMGSFVDVNTSSFSEGDVLYVNSGGGLTATKPTGTNLIQNIGKVGRSQLNNGEIVVMAIGRTNDVPNLPNGKIFIGSASNTTESAYTLPTADGTANQILKTNGSGAVSFSDLNILEDTAPQLGGDLDLNGNNIDGTGNIDIEGGFSMFADGGTESDKFTVVTHQYTFSDENEDTVYDYNATDGHKFYTSGSDRVNIKQNGDVELKGDLVLDDGSNNDTTISQHPNTASNVSLFTPASGGVIPVNFTDGSGGNVQADGNGDVDLSTLSLGGVASELQSASYFDDTGGQSVTSASFVTVDISDVSNGIEDSIFSNTGGVITVSEAGRYNIHTHVVFNGTTGNYRYTAELELLLNGTTVLGGVRGGYIRASTGSEDSYIDMSKIVDLSANDNIQVRIKRISTTVGNATLTPDLSTLQIFKMEGTKGADGSNLGSATELDTNSTLNITIDEVKQYNFDNTASSASTVNLTASLVGGYVEVFYNSATAPTITGATQFPNTASFKANTDMILCVKDFNNILKYWWVEF